MDINLSHLQRDPDYIRKNLLVTKDKRIIVTKDTMIHIPKRFVDKNLLILGEEVYSLGLFPIIMDNKYSVLNVMALLHMAFPDTNEVTIDETEYYVFNYAQGSEMIKNMSVVRDDYMTYHVFNELVSNGNVPWYMSYLDMAKLYEQSGKYADSAMVHYNQAFQIIVSMLARTKKDRMKLYRYDLNTEKDLTIWPDFVPLKSVMYVAQSTINKIAGSYMDEGVISALVHPSEHVERIEKLLRE